MPVRPELVEGLSFSSTGREQEGQGFDRLSPNGFFRTNARRLAGYAGAVLHWTPDAFWAATPDELAAIFEVLAGDAAVPTGAGEIARLMEVFPDG